MSRVVVTRALPGAHLLGRLGAAGHEVVVRPGDGPPSSEELRALVADADGVLTMIADRVDAELLAGAPRLRVVANYGVGHDNVDLDACARAGVAVGTTPDVLTAATAELALALLLAAARRLPEAEASVRAGHWTAWEPAGFLGLQLEGATVAVVGAGRIGGAFADRCAALGMRVLRVGRQDDLHAALAAADVVSLHAPLTPRTHHLIDAAALAAMRPHAILVNTARGGLVDQVALASALREGRIGAAALDVTDPEPLRADDPLLDAPRLVVLPHIGSATHVARGRMVERCVDNLLAGLAGAALPFPAAPGRAGSLG